MTPIHHITHIENLPTILREGALLCDREAQRRGLCSRSIAYDTIKQRRSVHPVKKLLSGPVAAGGVLADYVPFYFANRSPMLLAIHKGQVTAYQGGQSNIVYMVSSVEMVVRSKRVWCFTDGHALEGVTEFFDQFEELSKVDWAAVETWKWGGKWLLNDPDIKRRKQAEFLVHERFPLQLIERIGVENRTMADKARAILSEAEQNLHVTVEPRWYHNV
jgi:ssDNA thymidine ADP-ribosyltransferase, DarT